MVGKSLLLLFLAAVFMSNSHVANGQLEIRRFSLIFTGMQGANVGEDQNATFTVEWTNGNEPTLQLQPGELIIATVAVMDIEATKNSDFISAEFVNFTFSSGSSQPSPAQHEIHVLDDDAVEDDETIFVEVQQPFITVPSGSNTFIVVNQVSGSISIQDDDEIRVGITSTSYTVDEDAGTLEICVIIRNGSIAPDYTGPDLRVLLRPEFGAPQPEATDLDDFDFAVTNRLVSFGNGSMRGDMQCTTVTILNDTLVEPNEFFLIVATGGQGDNVVVDPPAAVAVVLIIDNDQGVPCFRDHLCRDLIGPSQDAMTCCGSDGGFSYENAAGDCVNCMNSGDFSCYGNETCINFVSNVQTLADCCSGPGCFYADQTGACQMCSKSGVGGDPHFSIVLKDGKTFCYNVQGRSDSVFNLIGCSKFSMNAEFVPDAKRTEVTWMRTIGVVLDKALHYKKSQVTGFTLDSKERTIHIGRKAFPAISIKEISSENGTISLVKRNRKIAPSLHPAVKFNLKDVGLHFTVKYESDHLDMYWHSPIKGSNCHGLIGQFFHQGIEVDEVRKILVMPNKPPVPVEWKPVWRFMERKAPEQIEQHCWKAMNPGLQGKGLIDGHYLDYLVEDVLSSGFHFEPIHGKKK